MASVQGETIDVLFVDDDDNWAELVRFWMGRRGWLSARAASYAQLVGYLNNQSSLPRCLLVDWTLTDANGSDVCRRIKSSPAWQALPVVILTGDRRVTTRECFAAQALCRVLKGDGGPAIEAELCAALQSVLVQQDRSLGLMDADDLRLDPRGGKVFLGKREIAHLAPAPFNALAALVRESPAPIPDARLHELFMARRPYRKSDPELTVRLTVRNDVYLLRRELGPVGARLVRAGDGYAYRPTVIDAGAADESISN